VQLDNNVEMAVLKRGCYQSIVVVGKKNNEATISDANTKSQFWHLRTV